jgi:hypothetical protein
MLWIQFSNLLGRPSKFKEFNTIFRLNLVSITAAECCVRKNRPKSVNRAGLMLKLPSLARLVSRDITLVVVIWLLFFCRGCFVLWCLVGLFLLIIWYEYVSLLDRG